MGRRRAIKAFFLEPDMVPQATSLSSSQVWLFWLTKLLLATCSARLACSSLRELNREPTDYRMEVPGPSGKLAVILLMMFNSIKAVGLEVASV